MSSPSRLRGRLLTCGGVVVLVLGGLAVGTLSPEIRAQSKTTPFSYTEAQADRGRTAFQTSCASCHGPNLDDGSFGPPLKGIEFRSKWGSGARESLDSLFTATSTRMPPDRPGGLGDATYADLLAFIVQENGTTAGATELPSEATALQAMAAPAWPRAGGGGLAPGVTLPPPPQRSNPLDAIRSVTNEMLLNPPAGAWLQWRRTYDAYGFSPLKGISTSNVSQLGVTWSWALPNGPNEATPLVHDGVMFVHSFGDKVQALDAVTGDLLWQYNHRLAKGVGPSVKRGIAILGTRLFVPTSDAHVVALDVRTGKVVWDRAIEDYAKGFRLTGGPLVAAGKVMIGTQGRAPGGNVIVGLDADTGAEAWRFHVIPQPGEPGDSTWNATPVEKRNGGSVWIPPSYDPVHDLAFFSPGNTYDTQPLRNLVQRPGVTNDGLYLDTTLALRPTDGRLAWHFQHQANGQWDLDWAFERQVMQLPVKGRLETVVLTAGKQMIYDLVEAETGKYISSFDLGKEIGLQNIVTGIDPETGAKAVDERLVPGDGTTKTICPHVDGGRDWMPASYNPATRLLYIPIVEACMDLVPVPEGERGNLSTGVRWTVRPKAGSDGKYGRLQAVNVETKKTVWVDRQRAPVTSGALATAGGVVFVGGLDRMFRAYDAATGAELWRKRLNDVPASVPIAYSVNGQDYIATVVGPGGSQSNAYVGLVPELQNPPDHGATLWVFEVPKGPARASR
jgi:PQQ-dependent dehydrogenase (methanol/ethanol family)